MIAHSAIMHLFNLYHYMWTGLNLLPTVLPLFLNVATGNFGTSYVYMNFLLLPSVGVWAVSQSVWPLALCKVDVKK